jgi:hypothetical protein
MMDDSINGGIVDNDTHATTSIQLESIIVYPIKSCAGFSVRVWPLSDCGKLTKPKAILFYQTCLLPFPMAFTFHWNIPNRHTLERCQKCKSLLLKHGYTHVFFPHLNTATLWKYGVQGFFMIESGWYRIILEIPLRRRKWVNFLPHKLWTPCNVKKTELPLRALCLIIDEKIFLTLDYCSQEYGFLFVSGI